ncbi:MAG: type II toxin-antitoxin system Phd/YefM family antitoxin [Bacteroidales bacterium]|nr:type II toxin-antitoxin system Phd/YefM family antitoxin [Bacteroidales bacterium]
MIVANISDFGQNVETYLDKVSSNFESLMVNHGENENVAIISLGEYNSLVTTNHELSSRKNEARLDSAIEKLRGRKSFEKSLIEV